MLQARESAAATASMLQGAPLRYYITKLRRAGQCFARGTLSRRERRISSVRVFASTASKDGN